MYPGFPVPNIPILAIWDTSEPIDDFDEPVDEEQENGEKDEFDNWDIDEEDEFGT